MLFELIHIMSRYSYKPQCLLLGFYVVDQHKVAENCEAEGKGSECFQKSCTRWKYKKSMLYFYFGPFYWTESLCGTFILSAVAVR